MDEVSKILDSDEDLQALFKAVGFVVIQFGHAEQSLDLMVASIYQNSDIRERPKRIPKMLEPKLEYLRGSAEKSAVPINVRTELRSLISAFKKMSKLRNDIIHGAIADVSAKEGAFKFAKLDIHDGFHHVREFSLDLTKFPELADELIELGRHANVVGQKVHDVYHT